MSDLGVTAPGRAGNGKAVWLLALLFVVIAAAGLFYVKWWPYAHKAVTAADRHSIGSPILADFGAHAEAPSWSSAVDYAKRYFKSVWQAAALGILLGSLAQALLPRRWILRQLGQATFRSTLLGGIVAVPGMMCTCCAAPIATGMRKMNASIGASLAFWLGNPVLNPATLIFMTFVLSWKYTVLRLACGLVLTFGVGYAANRWGKHAGEAGSYPLPAGLEADEQRPFLLRWLISLGKMAGYVLPAYLLTVLLMGAFQSSLFPVDLRYDLLAIVIFAVAGTLFVIPTAAEIPIVQSALALGVGAGPAAALLMTLPAVSLPSVILVWRSFPKKALLLVVLAVVAAGIVAGLIGEWLL